MNSFQEVYAEKDTQVLLSLLNDIKSLQKEAIPYLIQELSKRGEHETVFKISELLISDSFKVSDDLYFEHIIKKRKEGWNESQVEESLSSRFSLSKSYIELIQLKLKKSGKENLFIGSAFIIIPILFFMIIAVSIQFDNYLSFSFPLILVFVLIASGSVKIKKGYEQVKINFK